ncbi:hypothetical protein ACF1BS_03595 [Streptomyces sp. NPDC014748]|uniref:hypothetical protein n=1 Tax=Streptomyces sp. NPDC014748 TaxID=3364905 RepID=UPI003702DA26
MKPEMEFDKAAQRLRTQPDVPQDPKVMEHVADLLGCLAMLDPSERSGDKCGWCGSNHVLDIARAVNGGHR